MRKFPVLQLIVLASFVAPAAHAISGVCPDGSIYIVQNAQQIPCKASKQVEPSEMPPLRPDYLPTPYTWQVWNERHDPNNPYNVIDSAREVRGYEPAAVQGAAGAQATALPPVGARGERPTAAVSPEPATAAGVAPLDLGLADAELRDLFTIVELSQQQVPANLSRRTADGQGVFELSFARSAAFEQRLRAAWKSRGGLGGESVLLFSANSKRPEDFWANLTFAQGHLSFQPDRENPRQLGVLQGRLGALEGGEIVLGYVVLPERWDLGQSLDVYWNDRHLATTFLP